MKQHDLIEYMKTKGNENKQVEQHRALFVTQDKEQMEDMVKSMRQRIEQKRRRVE